MELDPKEQGPKFGGALVGQILMKVRGFPLIPGIQNTIKRESEKVPLQKAEPENCFGDQHQDMLGWKFLFRTQSHTHLQEWNLLRRSKAQTLGVFLSGEF